MAKTDTVQMTFEVKDDGTVVVKNASKKMRAELAKTAKSSVAATKKMGAGFKAAAATMATMFIGLVAINKLMSFGKGIIDYGDRLNKLEMQLGISANAMDRLKRVAELAGVEFGILVRSFTSLVRNLDMARRGTGDAALVMKSLGLNVAEIIKMKPEEQMLSLAEAIMKLPTQFERSNASMKLFGISGTKLLAMMPELRKQFEEMTSAFNTERAKTMATFNDRLTEVWHIIQDLAVVTLDPFLTQFVDWIAANEDLIKQNVPIYIDKVATAMQKLPGALERAAGAMERMIEIYDKWAKIFKDLGPLMTLTPGEDAFLLLVERGEAVVKSLGSGAKDLKYYPITYPKEPKKPSVMQAKEITVTAKSLYTNKSDELNNAHVLTKKHYERMRTLQITNLQDNANRKEAAEKADNIRRDTYAQEQFEKDEERREADVVSYESFLEARNARYEKAERDKTNVFMKELEERKALQEDFANYMADNFTNAFMSVIDGTQTMKEAFADMAISMMRDATQMIIRMLILKAIMAAMGMGAGGGMNTGAPAHIGAGGTTASGMAKGGAFSNGNLIPFASGGVVSRPTIFPMARGTGLMGEAGPEAIMPLTRTASGNLGVESEGGGGDTHNLTIYAMDSQSFTEFARRNPGAIVGVMSDMANKGNGAFKQAVKKAGR